MQGMTVRRLGVTALLLLAGALAAGVVGVRGGLAATCPDESIKTKLEGADVAFVGGLLSRTSVPGAGVAQFDYRFVVHQTVKGDLARNVTVRAATLVDLDGHELTPTSDVDVGVLATSTGGRLVTSTCGLVDAGSLLGVADEPRGGAIKVGIGIVILAIVLLYSLHRLRRRNAGASGRGAPPQRP
jgi:hypothetical protein